MGNRYVMGQANYPPTLTNMQKLLANWQKSAQKTPRPPTGGLEFSQERKNDEGTGLTNSSHSRRKRRRYQYIFMAKCYNFNRYTIYISNFPYWATTEGETHMNFGTNTAASNKKK